MMLAVHLLGDVGQRRYTRMRSVCAVVIGLAWLPATGWSAAGADTATNAQTIASATVQVSLLTWMFMIWSGCRI